MHLSAPAGVRQSATLRGAEGRGGLPLPEAGGRRDWVGEASAPRGRALRRSPTPRGGRGPAWPASFAQSILVRMLRFNAFENSCCEEVKVTLNHRPPKHCLTRKKDHTENFQSMARGEGRGHCRREVHRCTSTNTRTSTSQGTRVQLKRIQRCAGVGGVPPSVRSALFDLRGPFR